MKTTLVLAILDGWGIGTKDQGNPIHSAQLKTMPFLEAFFPGCALQASGIAIGLPWGEEGNSEVGHLTIGAGTVLYQHFPRISIAIENGSFFEDAELKRLFAETRTAKRRLHLVGLLTEGNVHASMNHLEALIEMAKREACPKLLLHLFLDGRDGNPRGGLNLIQRVRTKLEEAGLGEIVSVAGRSFGMDRDKRWDRTEAAYRILTDPAGLKAETPERAIESAYGKDVSDEFIQPTHTGTGASIENNDAVFFFNFREDRMRQITECFWNEQFAYFPVQKFKNLSLASMIQYDIRSPLPVAFPTEYAECPLGKALSDAGKLQLRVAETEKYAHVTYFLNGLREKPFPGEYRILIPSERSAEHEKYPEMQASAITDRILLALSEGSFDVIIANYANADMVAHTGNFDATVQAVRIVDQELGRLVKSIEGSGNTLLVTADHGNAEALLDAQTGTSETKHNASPVPFFLVADRFRRSSPARIGKKLPITGILSDVAPTALEILNLPKPPQMTGQSLLNELLLMNE